MTTCSLRICRLALVGLAAALPVGLVVASGTEAGRADLDELKRCRALADDARRLACYDRAVPLAPAGGEAVGPGVAPRAAAAAPASQFGLPRSESAEAAQLKSSLVGPFEGWARGHRFELANGQVWEVVDNSVGVYRLRDPKVTVQRSALGSFFLEIEGIQQTPKVRRVK